MALFACIKCGRIKPGTSGRSNSRMPWRCWDYPDCNKLKLNLPTHYYRKIRSGEFKVVLVGSRHILKKLRVKA